MFCTEEEVNKPLPEKKRRPARSDDTYSDLYELYKKTCQFYREEYHNTDNETIKKEIELKILDAHPRRTHEFNIQQNNGGLYIQNTDCKKTWEHINPLRDLVDRFLNDQISVEYLLCPPIMWLSRDDDAKLRKAKLVKNTPDPFRPFKRYVLAGIDIETIKTIDGQTVGENWTINDHLKLAKKHYSWFK